MAFFNLAELVLKAMLLFRFSVFYSSRKTVFLCFFSTQCLRGLRNHPRQIRVLKENCGEHQQVQVLPLSFSVVFSSAFVLLV